MEQLTLICDVCGKPAVRSVTMKVDARNLVIDLCEADTGMLTKNARAPKRGRKAAVVLGSPASRQRRRGRPPGSKNTTTKRPTNGRRRRRRKAA